MNSGWRHGRAVFVALAIAIGAVLPAFAQSDIGAPPGKLIDIGGRRLHLHCTGSGAPTVILEAGASSFAIDWALVQPEIAKSQRVCSYDRAMSGWSDPRPDVETPARVAADLHRLLTVAGEKPPFVLTGASAGGIYVRIYQLEHPEDVVGLIFVDPSSEHRRLAMYQGEAVMTATLTSEQLLSTLPASGTVPIPERPPQTGTPFDRLPPDLYRTRIALDERLIAAFPDAVSVDVVHESAEGEREALARLLSSRTTQNSLRELPMVVLTRGLDSSAGLTGSHALLAQLSNRSRHTVVPEAGHEIHLYQPAAVVQAIQDVIRSARDGGPLPAR